MFSILNSIWKVFRGVFLLTSCMVFCLLLIFELKGLPESLVLGVKQNLKRQGLNVSIDSIQAGIVNGVHLNQVKIYDPDSPEHILLKAELIHVDADREELLSGKVNLEFLSIEKAFLNLVLSSEYERKELNLKNVDLILKRSNSEIVFEKWTCNWNNINFNLNGKIVNIRKPVEPQEKTDFKKFSLKYFNETFTPELKEAIISVIKQIEAVKFSGDIDVAVNFTIDSEFPEKSEIDLDLTLPEFEFRNLKMAGSVSVSLIEESVNFTEIRWKVNKNEFIQGSLTFNVEKNHISGSLSGRAYITKLMNSFYPGFLAELEIKAIDTPPSFMFKLTDSPLDDPFNWNVDGNISVVNTMYKKLRFNNLSAKVNYNGSVFNADNIKFNTPRLGGIASLELDLNANNLTISGSIIGDPVEIHHFLLNPAGSKNYVNIFKDFVWEESALPHFSGSTLISKINTNSPGVIVQSKFKAAGFSYKGVNIQKVSADVDVDLSEKVELTNINTQFTQGDANLEILMKGPDIGSVIEIKGTSTAGVRTLFKMVSPDWENLLSFLTLPSESETSLETVIVPDKTEESYLKADIKLDHIKCWNFLVENVNSKLLLKNKHLVYETKGASLYGGKLGVIYSQSFIDDIQSLSIKTEKVSLPGLLTRVSDKSLDTIAGAVTANLDLKILEADRKSNAGFALGGTGEVSITDGNFWKVPLLSQFMDNIDTLIPVNASGRIQEVHGKLEFKEHNIHVPEFVSDGSILAMSGNGDYNWLDNSFDFIFNTHYLKDVLSLPKPFNFDILGGIFAPVSTVMKGRLSGNLDDYSWQLENVRKIKDLIKTIPNALLYPFKKLFD